MLSILILLLMLGKQFNIVRLSKKVKMKKNILKLIPFGVLENWSVSLVFAFYSRIVHVSLQKLKKTVLLHYWL